MIFLKSILAVQDLCCKQFFCQGLRRDRFRTPMQWNSQWPNMGFSNASSTYIKPLYNNIDTSSSNENLKLFRTVAKLKSEEFSLQYGKIEFLTNLNEDIVAFLRRFNGKNRFVMRSNIFHLALQVCLFFSLSVS